MKKLFLLAALSLALFARPSAAQTVDSSNILVSNATFPAGVTTSASVLVPANLTSRVISFSFSAPQDQLNDPTNAFEFQVQRLDSDGVWREDAGFTWVGGQYFNKFGVLVDNSGAVMGWDDPPVGKQIRVVVNNQKQMTGMTVTDQFLN